MFGGGDAHGNSSLGRAHPNAGHLQGKSQPPADSADRQIGSSARPATPSDISPEAADFLNKSFEIDHNARPTAAQLLDHPFISPRNAPMISAQQAKNAMAQATKQREMMGMQSLSALAEVK